MNSLGYLAPRKVDFFFLFTSFKQNTALIKKKKRHQNKVFKLSSFIEFSI